MKVVGITGGIASGKSTLSTVIAGHEDFEIDKGEILFEDEDLIDFNLKNKSYLTFCTLLSHFLSNGEKQTN